MKLGHDTMVYDVHQSVKRNGAHPAVVDTATAVHIARMRLAEIRKSRGLSQRDLADMIGRDHSTVQRAEIGHHTAKLITYQMIGEALGVDLADLFSEAQTERERDFLIALRQIPEDRQSEVLALLRLVRGNSETSEVAAGPAAQGSTP